MTAVIDSMLISSQNQLKNVSNPIEIVMRSIFKDNTHVSTVLMLYIDNIYVI
jgi:hypothetical protein